MNFARSIAVRSSLSQSSSRGIFVNKFSSPASLRPLALAPVFRPTQARLYAECNEPTEVTPESIEKKIRASMKVTNMVVQDTSGNGSFFLVAVQSPEFNGLSMLKQHQMLNKILKGELKQVHGITLKTLADE